MKMNKFSFSIKTKLVLLFISLSYTTILTISYVNFIMTIKFEKDSFIQSSLIQANLLADFTASALVFEDKIAAKESLEKLSNDKDILRVIIYDIEHRVFSSYNPRKNNQLVKLNLKSIEIEDVDKFLYFKALKISVPIKHNDEIYGILYLEKSTQTITKQLEKVFEEIFILALILLLIIYIISILLSNYILKPILSLAKITNEISLSQNYNRKVIYTSNNEISILYQAFNSLLENINELRNNLEKKVDKRTIQLSSKTSLLESSLKDLKETQKQLIQAEKMSALGNLVSGIAHEVNTPLGNGITSASIITKESKTLLTEFKNSTLTRSVMEKRLNVLNDSSILLVKTLNYSSALIKSFKQISTDQITNDIRQIHLKEYIKEIFLTNNNKLKIIPVEIILIENTEINIKISPGVIAQIFNNLIQNSILHAFDNFKGKAKIEVNLIEDEEFITIKYKDNGLGVNKKIKDKIFEPFITTKRNKGGTGLGLNIVFNLVHKKLKGTLTLNNELKIGCEFIIKIPINMPVKENE